MLYKENPTDQWSYFYDTIEGFNYEEGYAYQLEVVITQTENPLADESSLQYSLLKIISKEKDNSIAQNIPAKSQESQSDIISIEYQAVSRGTFFQVSVSEKFIQKTIDRNLKTIDSRKCSKKDWETIQSLIQNIDLNTINALKAPTDKRLFDGAAHAQLKISYKTKIFTSNGFDHGNPPEEIKQLVNTILSLSESIE
ncbi:hypothetical protein GCM10022258_25890 [Aquimarina gracilis]